MKKFLAFASLAAAVVAISPASAQDVVTRIDHADGGTTYVKSSSDGRQRAIRSDDGGRTWRSTGNYGDADRPHRDVVKGHMDRGDRSTRVK